LFPGAKVKDVDIDVIYQIIHDDLTPLLEAIRFFIKEISEQGAL